MTKERSQILMIYMQISKTGGIFLSNPTLKALLKEYEQKRIKKEMELETKLNQFYQNTPSLSNLNDQINRLSIELSKSILLNKSDKKQIISQLETLKREKISLLKKLNITDSFFTPDYSCKLCNDTGYLVDNNNIMCSCLKQKLLDAEYNKSNISSLEYENFHHFDLDLFSDIADQNKYDSTISPKENMEKIKELALNFIQNFNEPQEKNLLFTGNTGLGKTFLTNCIANELLKIGKTVLYQTAPVMLDSIIDYRFGKKDSFPYDSLLNVDLLIIDDLGTESLNNMKFSELFNILNTRLLNQNHHITKTIISTNLSLNNLFKTYDERIFSRLVGYYNICRFFGEDLRYKKQNKEQKR